MKRYAKAIGAFLGGFVAPLLIKAFDLGSPAGREVTLIEVRDALLIGLLTATFAYFAPRNRYPDQLSAADTRSVQ